MRLTRDKHQAEFQWIEVFVSHHVVDQFSYLRQEEREKRHHCKYKRKYAHITYTTQVQHLPNANTTKILKVTRQ